MNQWSFVLQVSLSCSRIPKQQFCIQGGPKVLKLIHLPSIKIVVLSATGMTDELQTNTRGLFIVLYFPVRSWPCRRKTGRGRGRKSRPSLFPFLPLLSVPATQVTYLWWPYWFQVYRGVVSASLKFYITATVGTSWNKTLRSVHFGVVVVEPINCKRGGIVRNEIR